MDTPQKRPDAAVDEILAELRGKSGAPKAAADSELDRILAELKGGGAAKAPLPPAPGRQATQPMPVQAAGVPSAPGAGRPPAPVAQAAPAVQPPARAEFAQPPKTIEEHPEPKPPAQMDVNRAVMTETRRLPVLGDPSALQPIGPRAGKAAALEKVEAGKFVGDEELASWFDPEATLHTSKREMKRAEKARKKREKADEKERRQNPEPQDLEPEQSPPPLPEEPRMAVAQPEDGGAALREAFLEIQRRPDTEEGPEPVDFFNEAGPVAAVGPLEDDLHLPQGGVSLFEFAKAAAPPTGVATAKAPADNWQQPIAQQPERPQTAPPKATSAAMTQPSSVQEALPLTKAAPVSPQPPAAKPGEKTMAFQAIQGAVQGQPIGMAAPPTAGGQTQVFKAQAAASAATTLGQTRPFSAVNGQGQNAAEEGAKTQMFDAAPPAKPKTNTTKQFDLTAEEAGRVPTAAFTQEFETAGDEGPNAASLAAKEAAQGQKNLYVDEMVDDKFRAFFGETVIVDQAEAEQSQRLRPKRKAHKSRTALLTGEFAKLTEAAEDENDEDFDDYSRPQDAEQVEADLTALRKTLTSRSIISGVAALLLFWMAFGYTGVLPLPEFISLAVSPILFGGVYLAIIIGVIVLNFTTVASGLIGLFSEPTTDTTSAIAAVAALLQGVVLLVQLITATPADVTLFGAIAALVLCFNSLGKKVRSTAILENFKLASGGIEHSAAYVVDGGQEVAYHITKGLEEENPSILVSRPTALVKGFLRQSFSMRWSDRLGRILGWVLLGASLVAGLIAYITSQNLMDTITCLAATACIGAPLSATLISGVPQRLLQLGSSKVGAVVPGWSAIEELGGVNVVMAGARDVLPPSTVSLKGIKTFEQERIDLAILYAASILVEACDTLREVFLAVIQGKNEMLFKVENLLGETGRGFTGFVENNRVIIGTREMMQMHDIDPPPLEVEMKFTGAGSQPLYLAVSGKLFAMFIIAYSPDAGVKGTLEGLVSSGVSVLITSEDPNVTNELLEQVYALPKGVVKVMGRRELELMEPLRSYLPESEGVMTHIGTFTSFIGGMRAAAGCAASERMSTIVQAASLGLACLLCLLLAISGGLSILSLSIVLLYQLGWTLLVSALPFARRY